MQIFSNGLEFHSEILSTYLVILYGGRRSIIIVQLAYSVSKLAVLQCCHLAISAC